MGIYVYENSEVLDFSGPFEVFSTASRLSKPEGFFSVFLIAEDNKPVSARAGFNIVPHYGFGNHPEIDLLIVVGGIHAPELGKPNVLDWVSTVASKVTTVASVCTGVFILAEAGVISGLKVTTHWEDIEDLRCSYPDLDVIENKRWVDEGRVVTSGGITAGIDMSLHLVAKHASLALAEKTAKQMAFDWFDS